MTTGWHTQRFSFGNDELKAKEADRTNKPGRRKKRRPKQRDRIREEPEEERLTGLNLEYYELVRSF